MCLLFPFVVFRLATFQLLYCSFSMKVYNKFGLTDGETDKQDIKKYIKTANCSRGFHYKGFAL